MSEAAFDYSALAKLSERQQMKFLLSMTSSTGRAPLADRKANVNLQPVAVSKPAKAVLTPVLVCADDHDLGGDSDVTLALIDALFGGPQFVQACERHGKGLLRNRPALRQLEVWRQWRDACSADGRTWPTLPAPLLAACQASSEAKGQRR